MTDNPLTEESRRSFVKKSALATGAAALGISSTGSGAAQEAQQRSALVFADDFVPGGSFNVVGSLESTLTLDLLQAAQQSIPSPGNYNGYIINYSFTPVPEYAIIFVAPNGGGLDTNGTQYTFGNDANYFTGNLNLVETQMTTGGGDVGGTEGGGDGQTTTE